MANVVTITEKLDKLPFKKVLSWERFQLFCTDVLYKTRNAIDSREYLSRGGTQHGIDIYAIKREQKELTVAQCKLVESLQPKDIYKIVEDFLKGPFASQTAEFILCTNVALTKAKIESAIYDIRTKLANKGINLLVWDEGGLSMELRTSPSEEYVEIVYHYFDEQICKAFFGERWSNHMYVQQIKKIRYSAFSDYIERSITSYDESLKKPARTLWNFKKEEKTKQTLFEIVKNESQVSRANIVLLSTAGFGKSEELNQLAFKFSSSSESLYPIKFSLGNYTNQDIESILNQLIPNWKNIQQNNILLILDGIDEIGKPNDQTFYKKLNAFLEFYPAIHVVVSSRFNFYEITHQPLKGFNIYLLDPLSYTDIEQYLEKHLNNDKEAFLNLIYNKGFTEYHDNPYYLTRLVRLFNDKQESFPANKTQLFERILFEQISKDQTSYQIPELRLKLYQVASFIAFCLTLSDKKNVTEEELASLIADESTRRHLYHFYILRRDVENQENWSFEHKNMQEYLCAYALRKLTFQKLLEIITVPGEQNKILPKFLNTISFLFELLDRSDPLFIQLLNWISSCEPELLVRFERGQIEKETRNEIFFRLFALYKEKGLSMRTSSNFSIQQLSSFVVIDETIVDFLAAEVNPSLSNNLVYDAIYIVSQCERSFTIGHKLKIFIFDLIENPNYSQEIKASCIHSLKYLKLTDRETFDRVFAFAQMHTHNDIRSATISLLEQTSFQDDFDNYIFEIFKNEALVGEERIPRETIKRMVLKFNSPRRIKDLIRFVTVHPKVISQHHYYRSLQFNLQETKDIIAKATSIYRSDRSIVPMIYRLYIRLEFISVYNEWISVFVDFFERTCGKETIFLKFYKYGRRPFDMLHFSEEKTCDFIIEEIRNRNVSTEEAIVIRNVLSNINNSLYQYFYEKMKALPNASEFIVEVEDIDYNSLHLVQGDKNQELLLDKASFIAEASEIFSAFGKEIISVRDLWFSKTKSISRFRDSIVLKCIREMSQGDDNQTISRTEYLSKLNESRYWDGLVVESIKNLLESDKTKESVRPELITLLTNWTINEIERIDFENESIIEHEDGSYSYFQHTEFVKQCVELLKPNLSDDLLINLLKADYGSFYSLDTSKNEEEKRSSLASIVIEKVKDKKKLKIEIIKNIQDPKTPYRVRATHFKMCQILGYRECLPELFSVITADYAPDSFYRIKLTEIYISLGGEWKDFKDFLSEPESPNYDRSFIEFHWHLLQQLLYEEKEKSTEIIFATIKENRSESSRLKAVEFLIKLSRVEGLHYWFFHFTSKKQMPFENRWETYYDYFRKMPFGETVNLLIDALDFIYRNPLSSQETKFWRCDDVILNSIVNLAIQGNSQLVYVREKLEQLLEKTQREDFRYTIKFFMERIRISYYQSISYSMGLEEASDLYTRIFKLNKL
jgi:hypothetical protein